MKESFVGVVILAVIFLLGYLVLAFAQEGTDKKNADLLAKKSADGTPNASRFLHTRPDLHYAADVRFSLPTGQERVLYVVPQNKGSDLHVNGLFFITPAFALEEGEKRNDGYPDVVQAAEKQPDGSTELRFKAILNSDQLNQQARDALLHQPQARALWTKEGLKEVDIQVKPYSVVHAIIALVDLWHEDNFIAVTQSEIRGGSSTEFGFRLTQQELANVNSLANKGRLGFVYSWSFVGKGQDYGEIDLEAIRNLKVSLKSKLTSEQLDGKAPIFQAEANEAARHVALLIRRTGRSNNPNILAIVNTPSLMQHLFVEDKDGITLENLKNTDPEKAKQIAAYLTPQIETLREAIKTEEATRKTNEKTDFIVTKTDDSVSFGIGVILKGIGINFGFGSSSENTRGWELKNRLEAATGTEWQVAKDKSTLIPHKIRTYKFIQGSDHTLLSDRSNTYISVDKENYYYQDKAIAMTFTNKTMTTIKPHQQNDPPGYDGIPLGAVIPYFGNHLPKGYRWCYGTNDGKDRKNVFPNADWVPERLRGMPLPDMREHLIGGAKKDSDVGLIFNKGRITLQKVTVAGSNFAVPMKQSRLAGDGYIFRWQNADGWEIGKPELEKSLPKWVEAKVGDSGFFMRLTPVRAFFDTPQGSISGQHVIEGVKSEPMSSAATNPRHVMCRWIIRVE